jgi:putative restriction endonuclease
MDGERRQGRRQLDHLPEPKRAGRRGYYAVAKVENIVPDPANEGMFLALIQSGSYWSSAATFPFRWTGQAVEGGC